MIFKFKQVLKLFICNFIYYSGLLHLYIKCVFLKKQLYPIVIINYHSFVQNLDGVMEIHPTVTMPINEFHHEIKFLKKYFQFVSLDYIVDKIKKRKICNKPMIAITVDDGFKNNFDLLFPILKKNNIPATIFLSTGVIGTNNRLWVNDLADMISETQKETLEFIHNGKNENFPLNSISQKRHAYFQIIRFLKNINLNERDKYLKGIREQLGALQKTQRTMLNWDEVKIMHMDMVSIGAHTVNHPILTNITEDEAKQEILESKETIENRLGIQIKHFAYPNGRTQDFNEKLRKFCKDIGFLTISTCDYGNNSKVADLWALKRIGADKPISLFALNVIRAFNKK